MADLEHAGRGPLRCGRCKGHLSVWTARYHERRSGIPVHLPRPDGPPASVGIGITWRGRGRDLCHILIERLWRTLRYQCAHLHARKTGSLSRAEICRWMKLFHSRRPHKSLVGGPKA